MTKKLIAPEAQPLVKVKFSEGLTISGKYQSWRMDVGMEMDCPQGEEDATFDALKASVEQKLVDTIKENKESVGVLIGEAKKKLEDNIEG